MSHSLSASARRSSSRSAASASRTLRRAACATIEGLEGRTLLSSTLTPVADTFVRNHNYALANFGASPLLFVKNASSGDSRVAYLKFDLSGVSAITNATLELSGALVTPVAPPTDAGIFAVSDNSWVEGDGTVVNSIGDGFDTDNNPAGEMTWNNAPALTGSALATATVSRDTFQTYNFDVTSYLQQQLAAGAQTVTLAIQNIQPTAAGVSEFLSRESSNDPSTAGEGAGPQLVITNTSAAPPTAIVTAPDVTAPSASTLVTVGYNSDAGIDASTIDASDIVVRPSGGGAPLDVSAFSTSPGGNGTTLAYYTVDAPGGSWSASANGPYTVTVKANAVKDANGAGVSASYGAFRVQVGDAQPPVATISAPNVTAGGASTYSFTVTYSDNVAVDPSTITTNNVGVTGPVGPLHVTGVSVAEPTPGDPRTVIATYTAEAPNGAWDATANGAYVVNLRTYQVYDTATNPAAATTGNFDVAIAVPDTAPPTVASVSAPSIMGPGAATETVTVVYQDNVGFNTTTIDRNDITVTGPSGAALAVTGATFTPSNNGQTITASYTVAAPSGAWSAADNGTYTISVVAGQVTDSSQNPVGTASGTFNVSAATADTQPPTAAISAPAITTAGGATQTITVVYTDNVSIDTSSINASNISVSGPSGPLTVTAATFVPANSGKTVTATYTVIAPNNSWDASADGTYNVALNANQVRDGSGNTAPIVFGSFAVNIPNPNPADPTFGGSGGTTVTSPFNAEAVATQPDGKILVAGHQSTGNGQSQGVLQRLNPDGSIDTTFGTQGQVVTPAGNIAWYAIVMQGLNHVVLAGNINGDFALARYDFNGNLDPTFGKQGLTVTDFGTANDTAYGVAVAPNNQIVAAGTSNMHFALARYDANGNLDGGFGQGGRQLVDTGGATQLLGAVAVAGDGKVVAAGSSDGDVDVVRLTATGDLDETFNGDGVLTVAGLAARQDASTGPDYTEAIALQPDGKILVANKTAAGHMGLARLADDGKLDATFGTNGVATANFGGDDDADAVVVQDTGAILVVGTSLQNGTPMTGVAAFDSSGNAISGFGNGGRATFAANVTPASRELHIGDLVLRAFGSSTSGGKLLVGSSAIGTQTVSSSLRRLIVPGTKSAPGIARTSLGVIAAGKRNVLKIDLGDNRTAVVTITNASGNAWQVGNDIELDLTDTGAGAVVKVNVHGGGAVSFSDVTVTGNLKSFTAKTGNLTGSITATGSIGKVACGTIAGNVTAGGSVGNVTSAGVGENIIAGAAIGTLKLGGSAPGVIRAEANIAKVTVAGDVDGSVSAGGSVGKLKATNVNGVVAAGTVINNITAASMSGAKVLAGANLGTDGKIGGSGTAQDVYVAGVVNNVKVAGGIAASLFAAGASPVNGIFGDGDDQSVPPGGMIKSITAKSVDADTRFEAAAFKSAKLPGKVDTSTDEHFKTLS